MKILTGRHRAAYDALLVAQARDEARCEALSQQTERDAQEIKRLLALVEHERRRAENATDELLAVRGMAPVTPLPPAPPELHDEFGEDLDAVAKYEKEAKERGIGVVLAEAQR